MSIRTQVEDWFKYLNNNELVDAWNTYCINNNYIDDYIYDFSDPDAFFDENYSSSSQAVTDALLGDVHLGDAWILPDNGHGMQSFNDPVDYIDADALIDDAIENPNLYNITIENEYDDEEEI